MVYIMFDFLLCSFPSLTIFIAEYGVECKTSFVSVDCGSAVVFAFDSVAI